MNGLVTVQREQEEGIRDACPDRIAECRRLLVDDDVDVIPLLFDPHDP
jgi:hypothetical protein